MWSLRDLEQVVAISIIAFNYKVEDSHSRYTPSE